MNQNDINNFLEDSKLSFVVQHEQFFDWLKKIFFLSTELQTSYNRFYQELLYIHVYQLLNEGMFYIQDVLKAKTDSSPAYDKFKEIASAINKLKTLFSEDELDLIEYQRHCCCHIFQNHYERQINRDGITSKRKGKSIKELRAKFNKMITGNIYDKGFNKYFNDKVIPVLLELYQKLQN